MNKIRTFRNEDVNKILVGVPEGHKHLRITMKLKNGLTLIFQEATIASILRVYTTVKTHPSIRAQELENTTLTANLRKEGYAVHQLLETPRKNEAAPSRVSSVILTQINNTGMACMRKYEEERMPNNKGHHGS